MGYGKFRNMLCHCKSGKKYKVCCYQSDIAYERKLFKALPVPHKIGKLYEQKTT